MIPKLLILMMALPVWAVDDDSTVCSTVSLQISQDLTLERQGFEAQMHIINSLDGKRLEHVRIDVLMKNENEELVTISSDTTQSGAKFFIRLESHEGIQSVTSGDNASITDGVIEPDAQAWMRWMIIPTAGAAGGTSEGKLYFVSATFTYAISGEDQTVTVAPDSIVVKPQPQLELDYFIPRYVHGDDAFTTDQIEPAEPFTVGTRLTNTGFGDANEVTLQSVQPRILENDQDLAIDYTLTQSFVNDYESETTLRMNYGNLARQDVVVGRWIMESSLSGRFLDMTAIASHAAIYGGELTSLLQVNTPRFLLRDIKVDLSGRDSIKDFLASDISAPIEQNDVRLFVFESEAAGAISSGECKNCTEVAKQILDWSSLGSEMVVGDGVYQRTVSASVNEGFTYIRIPDPYNGSKEITKTTRSDGKDILTENIWLSKIREKTETGYRYYINIFDYKSSDRYTVQFGGVTIQPLAPVFQVVNDRVTHEGQIVSFNVRATDPNETTPLLSVGALPINATFESTTDNEGTFSWSIGDGQTGKFPITFVASDEQHQTRQTVMIIVNPANDIDGDHMLDAWEISIFGNLDRTGLDDYDLDGLSDLVEYDAGSDPTEKPFITLFEIDDSDVGAAKVNSLVLINGSTPYFLDRSSWGTSSDSVGFYGVSLHQLTLPGNGRFIWEYTPEVSGTYTLTVKIPAISGEAAEHAVYTIETATGRHNVTLSQKVSGDKVLDSVYLQAGQLYSVTLRSRDEQGMLLADLLKLSLNE